MPGKKEFLRSDSSKLANTVEKVAIGIAVFLIAAECVPIIILCCTVSWLYLLCLLDIPVLVLSVYIIKLFCSHCRDTEAIANMLVKQHNESQEGE